MSSALAPPVAGRRAATVALAVLLAAVLLILSLRGVVWREVGRVIAAAEPGYLGLAAVIASGTLLLRALRWRVLLNARGEVSIATAFWATAAGYLANNVFPARAGELVRTVMVVSRSGLAAAFVLATALAERAADAVVLVGIGSVIVLTVPAPLGWLAAALKPLAVLGLAIPVMVAVLPRLEPYLTSVLARTTLRDTWKSRLQSAIHQVLAGLRVFHHRRRLLKFAGLTVLIWSLDAFTTVIGGAALGLGIPVPAAFLLLAALGLGSALPSAPGYVGIYQFAAVSALTPFGFSRADAIAYILVAQALMIAVMALWGSLGLLQYRRSGPGISNAPSRVAVDRRPEPDQESRDGGRRNQ